MANYGLCPFQISFPNFTTFNRKEKFVDHKIIIVSVIFLILTFSYAFSKLFSFGQISGLSEDFFKNSGYTDKTLEKDYEIINTATNDLGEDL